jgi:hypothetical protein
MLTLLTLLALAADPVARNAAEPVVEKPGIPTVSLPAGAKGKYEVKAVQTKDGPKVRVSWQGFTVETTALRLIDGDDKWFIWGPGPDGTGVLRFNIIRQAK